MRLPSHLSASDGRAQGVLANRNLVIDKSIGEAVLAMSHCSDEDDDVLILWYLLQIRGYFDGCRIEREGNLVRIAWQMVCDWVLDDFEQLFASIDGADRQLVK